MILYCVVIFSTKTSVSSAPLYLYTSIYSNPSVLICLQSVH